MVRLAVIALMVGFLGACAGCDKDDKPDPQPDMDMCAEGESLCDDVCISTTDDIDHCGGCEPCEARPGTEVDCTLGECRYDCSAGFVDVNGDLSDGCECQNSGQEICDGVDNDCNGETDEEGDDLLADCVVRENANVGACEDGVCVYDCQFGFIDLNEDLTDDDSDGCECVPSTEICDGIDNDCDGEIDVADIDLVEPEEQCPAVAGALVTCFEGGCFYICEGDFQDANGDLNTEGSDGCECPTEGGEEVCDGSDNDCDGDIDNPDAPNLLSSCAELANATAAGCSDGLCQYICADGFADLNNDLGQDDSDGCECTISDEVCDGEDNDCDGTIDNSDAPTLFDDCQTPNTTPTACVDGQCQLDCNDRFVDIDDNRTTPGSNGCECLLDDPIDEVCDGRDNNCNGLTDEADLDHFIPDLCPIQDGVCEGSPATCDGGQPLLCQEVDYADHSDLFTSLFERELLCDGEDNNCNGDTDENCCDINQGVFPIDAPQSDNLFQITPAIAANDDNTVFLVAWQESTDSENDEPTETGVVRIRVVNQEGIAIGDTLSFDNPNAEDIQPTAAWNGSEFWVAWINEGLVDSQLFTLKIAPNAVPLTSQAPVVSLARSSGVLRDPTMVKSDEGEVLLTWSQGGDCLNTEANACIRSATLAQNGTLGPIRELSEDTGAITARSPSIALKPNGGFIAWHDTNISSLSVKWAPLNVSLDVAAAIQSSSLNVQDLTTLPSIAVAPGGAVVSFANEIGGNLQIFSIKTDGAGVIQGDINTLTTGAGDKNNPRLVSTDDGLKLLWIDGNEVVLQPLDNNGEADGDPIVLLENQNLNFSPASFLALPQIGFVAAFGTQNADEANNRERVQMSIFNPEGDRLCLP